MYILAIINLLKMKTSQIVLIALFIFITVAYISFLEKRDEQLMALCADHQTRTLYECK